MLIHQRLCMWSVDQLDVKRIPTNLWSTRALGKNFLKFLGIFFAKKKMFMEFCLQEKYFYKNM